MAGAIGLMTLGVMSRATLGHTGRDLHAGGATIALFAGLVGSVAARLAAGAWPMVAMPLSSVAGVLWIAAFGGFALVYGPVLMRPKLVRA